MVPDCSSRRLGGLNSLVIIPSAPWRTISQLTSADLPLPPDQCQQRGQSCKYRWKHPMFGVLWGFLNAHPGKTQCTRQFLLRYGAFMTQEVLVGLCDNSYADNHHYSDNYCNFWFHQNSSTFTCTNQKCQLAWFIWPHLVCACFIFIV